MKMTHCRDFKPADRPLLAVLTLADWKSGDWLSRVPKRLAQRIERAGARLKDPADHGTRFAIPGLGEGEEDALVAILPKEEATYFALEFARETWNEALHPSTRKIALLISDAGRERQLADAFGSALATRTFLMPAYGKKKEKQKPWQLRELTLISPTDGAVAALERGRLAGEGSNIARRLATLPPNFLDPAQYAREIARLCKENGLSHKFHSKAALRKLGAGAFTAVDQGDPGSEGGIHEISYSPRAAAQQKPVTLVGKGLCFDTGGYDVKINGGMRTMKGDMQGSAVALASIVTAARLKLPLRMKAYLAVTENHLSPSAYKADEVVTALNGLTIEVVNTDAEGRMVLADTLALASRERPRLIIDYATLTGSAVRAIGTRFSAGFTNRKELHARIVECGETSGERVWTFPIDSTYFKLLESNVADTLQCTKSGGPDHILASCFLSRFVGDGIPWIHVDLSASENDDGLAHVDSMFTGFGVRWTLEYLDNHLRA
jgi:leucyl aminopeptidase